MEDLDGPLILADGTQIDPKTGRVVKVIQPREFIEIPTNGDAQKRIAAIDRRIGDLPDVPKRMTPIAVVLSYTLFGLPSHEIAVATGLTKSQIENIQQLDAYQELSESIVESIRKAEGNDVRQLVSDFAHDAATTVVNMLASTDDKIALSAAKDILDRDGHRPSDVIEHRHKLEGGLVIEHVKRDLSKDVPTIELTVEDM